MTPLSRLVARLPQDVVEALEPRGSPAEVWERSEDGAHLLWLALAAGVERRLVVGCALSIAERALAAARPSDMRPARALKVADAWLRGVASGSEAWAAGFAAMQAAEASAEPDKSPAIRAAASVAFACDDLADDAYYALTGYCARAAEHASEHLAPADAAACVRARVPSALFEACVERASRPLSLAPELEPLDGFYT